MILILLNTCYFHYFIREKFSGRHYKAKNFNFLCYVTSDFFIIFKITRFNFNFNSYWKSFKSKEGQSLCRQRFLSRGDISIFRVFTFYMFTRTNRIETILTQEVFGRCFNVFMNVRWTERPRFWRPRFWRCDGI